MTHVCRARSVYAKRWTCTGGGQGQKTDSFSLGQFTDFIVTMGFHRLHRHLDLTYKVAGNDRRAARQAALKHRGRKLDEASRCARGSPSRFSGSIRAQKPRSPRTRPTYRRASQGEGRDWPLSKARGRSERGKSIHPPLGRFAQEQQSPCRG